MLGSENWQDFEIVLDQHCNILLSNAPTRLVEFSSVRCSRTIFPKRTDNKHAHKCSQ